MEAYCGRPEEALGRSGYPRVDFAGERVAGTVRAWGDLVRVDDPAGGAPGAPLRGFTRAARGVIQDDCHAIGAMSMGLRSRFAELERLRELGVDRAASEAAARRRLAQLVAFLRPDAAELLRAHEQRVAEYHALPEPESYAAPHPDRDFYLPIVSEVFHGGFERFD